MARGLRIGYGGARTIAADQGTFTLSGQAANLLRAGYLAASSATFSISGQAATLTYSGAAPSGVFASSPHFVTATANGGGQVTLTWTPTTTNDDGPPATTAVLTGHKAYWSTTTGQQNEAGSSSTDSSLGPSATSKVITGLTPGSTMYLAVASLNTTGTGNPSPETSVLVS